MKLKLIASVLVLVLALSGVLGATSALFTSDAAVNGTLTAGTLNLVVNDKIKKHEIILDPMKPGDSRDYQFILKNAGTVNGLLNIDAEVKGSDKLIDVLKVETYYYNKDGQQFSLGSQTMRDWIASVLKPLNDSKRLPMDAGSKINSHIRIFWPTSEDIDQNAKDNAAQGKQIKLIYKYDLISVTDPVVTPE